MGRKSTKKRILFVLIMPPPVHGMSMVCAQIKTSRLINSEFECRYINSAMSRTMNEIGKCGLIDLIRKGMRYIGAGLNMIKELIFFRPQICYCSITCHGKAFLKDALFVLLAKLFGCRVVIHQHNRGMSDCVQRFPYRWLLPLVYRHARVVLLSWRLYDDVSAVVKPEQVRICPNGIE